MSQEQADGFPGLQEQVDPATVHIHILLDVSLSMVERWKQTISGLNEYIDGLRQDPNPCKITITEFGLETEVNALYTDVNLDEVGKFDEVTFYPHGKGTALWSAVGMTLKKVDTKEPVLFVVITDGEDNSSRTYGSDSVNKLIEERVALGNYTFAYLGVDKAAWGQEAKIQAFAASNSVMDAASYSAETYKNLGLFSNNYRSIMRVNHALQKSGSNVSMSVSNLFAPEVTEGTEEEEK